MEHFAENKGHDNPTALTFPPSFFEDEVREGFFVPETMKRFWAGHLTVLRVVADICERHRIRWFAAFGTLLGTVRHKGFIPWDDDIDIVMFRSDLDRFLEIAKEELPEYLGIRDVQTQPEYNALCVRVTSTFLDKGHLEHFHGSLYSASVDIFALDNLYDDPEKEQERMRRLGIVCSAGAYFQPKDGGIDSPPHTLAEEQPEQAEAAVRRVEALFGKRLDRKNHLFGHLLQLIIKVFRACPEENSRKVVLFMDNEWLWCKEREWFRDTKWLPFEHLSMPVSTDYEAELQAEYGDWHIIRRGGGHGAPAYTEQEAYMREKTGKNMFRYTYSAKDLQLPRTPSLKARVTEMLAVLKQALQQAEDQAVSGNEDAARQLLVSCQTLAVRLGETIETARPGNSDSIRLLESFCEAVFDCHGELSADGFALAGNVLEQAEASVKQMFDKGKEIVFLPVRASWWKTMEPVYHAALAEENTVVRVMPVTWQERGENGEETGVWHDERGAFPADIPLTAPEEYDLAARCPDVIVTQFPYEGLYRPVSVDPLYFASSLRNLTERLVYVPCYDVETPGEEDFTARNTLRYLIEQPSVVLADQVIVATEGMRQLYIEVMREIAGTDTEAVWKNKVSIALEFSKT